MSQSEPVDVGRPQDPNQDPSRDPNQDPSRDPGQDPSRDPSQDPTDPADATDGIEATADASADVPVPESNGSRERVRHVTGVDPGQIFDHDKIERAVRMLFEAIGEDPDREGLRETPSRVAREYDEIFAGLLVDPGDVLTVVFEEGHDEMVMVRDIPLHSMCEHHLLPFTGRAHVAYIPNEKGQITGLSKIARLVDVVSKRPNLQERLTTTIADVLEERLEPRGVLVVIEARHLCMDMRGVRKPGSETVTSTVRGNFRSDPRTRAEAMALIHGDRRNV